ncbi:hypothetical protein [Actinophytocola xanthii]|uniref:Uncharacterized protein n=1 Tax=Actinophytocola xanthii TaxID=1912961 RepID=A0A1Q8C8T1_9PSEU|nr:hypothetical protein [Actinophytocola xanthii]OLF10761.1 hypothetical protein BU204_31165 [Actinophytocola xanthii]
MGDVAVTNVVLLVVAVLAPTVLFWLLLRLPRVVDGLGAAVRRRRGPSPTGPPIERLAADLERVRRTLAEFPPGTPQVRRRAAGEAYDALLAQACRAVDVPHTLDQLPQGMAREVERLRVEEALRRAGIS